jgi:hypothetical protein
VPVSLDLNGVLASLGAPVRSAPADPLDELAAAVAVARVQLQVFDPNAQRPVPRPVARPGRRAGL